MIGITDSGTGAVAQAWDVELADEELLDRLRAGDEQAFAALVGRYHGSMLRLARSFVASDAVAEEVVQDTWLGVLRGISKFEGRSALKTWLFAILVNRGRTTGSQEARSIAIGEPGPAVDPGRFDAAGRWASPPVHWVEDADDRIHAAMLTERIRVALEQLPSRQRQVVILRDVEGLGSEEVCSMLGLSDGNQRVLLHRGRARLRQDLESDYGRG